jgi:hypothetical protein
VKPIEQKKPLGGASIGVMGARERDLNGNGDKCSHHYVRLNFDAFRHIPIPLHLHKVAKGCGEWITYKRPDEEADAVHAAVSTSGCPLLKYQWVATETEQRAGQFVLALRAVPHSEQQSVFVLHIYPVNGSTV